MNGSYQVEDNTLYITKKNEVYIKVDCVDHIVKELSEYFTFLVPNHTFIPKVRERKWDGKIRLYDMRSKTIYAGLIKYIQEFAGDRGYKVDFGINGPDIKEEFSVYLAQKFFDELQIQAHGQDAEARDYQLNAFVHAMRSRRAILLSPTASGKSLIIYMLMRQMMQYKGYRGLILVSTTSLVEQLYTDFQDYSSVNGFSVNDNIHKIYDYKGMTKFSDKNVYISTWQSLYTLDSDYFHKFDYIIGDEAHLYKAQSLKHIMTSCINAKYRIGLTGSLDNSKTNKLVLEGLFGEVEKVTTTKKLMDDGTLATLTIKCLVLKHSDENSLRIKKLKDYKQELEYLILNEQRNKFIKNLALSLKGNSLILYQFVDKHGQILYDSLRNSASVGNKKIHFIHGGVETKNREIIRKLLEESNDNIIVASFGTFSTGINIRALDNLIIASPSKSKIRILQSLGRSLRTTETKTTATVFDIADDMRVGNYMNTTLKHFVERIRIYAEEQFTYKIYKIQLRDKV